MKTDSNRRHFGHSTFRLPPLLSCLLRGQQCKRGWIFPPFTLASQGLFLALLLVQLRRKSFMKFPQKVKKSLLVPAVSVSLLISSQEVFWHFHNGTGTLTWREKISESLAQMANWTGLFPSLGRQPAFQLQPEPPQSRPGRHFPRPQWEQPLLKGELQY